ncbi:L-lactate dehydrogenase complex protein LldF [Chryseolinea serpens]|uniref:L-lactate dehydrogenase complex protein LldF n=1 Tax=Chryseolinea serpens TaxID=947013 RepID=A0A1M5TC24_9BACT|nr:lactate utilization protein B [Chryseolinea serpens]SHH48236.1 L-lactate dehydrogenase complex protein LldF [Chryseolinea serpens]
MRKTETPLSHASLAESFNKDEQRVNWHDQTLWFIREKRDKAAWQIPEWEQLREVASTIKSNVLANLHEYLTAFEKAAINNGAVVHWAENAEEHNKIVLSIIQKHKASNIVKSKSMLTEECHLNAFLAKNGVDVVDTDLGERIVQLANEPPSHIVLPCIHWKKEEIGELFHQHLGTPKGNADPQFLTGAARKHLRTKFLSSSVAITGVNFAVSETGEVVVCTNEGNADLGVQLADVHIACMGIEKIIPKRRDLGVFLRLLTRSATGQPITTYSSHFKTPRKGQEMHIVLVDNGRSQRLASDDFRNALKCIRCGACFNTCPVYRRSGGHSYHTAVAGPIGSILSPGWDIKKYSDLPSASTLCGSCSNVCPVKIDIHDQLYKWRQEITKKGNSPKQKTILMNIMNLILSHPVLFNLAGSFGRKVMKWAPSVVNNRINPWYKQREMPEPPPQSFTEWYKKNNNGKP